MYSQKVSAGVKKKTSLARRWWELLAIHGYQIGRRGSVNRAMARCNRGIRAKDSSFVQKNLPSTPFLTAVLFNLPLIIVFCSRVYEDRPMIRITRGVDCSDRLYLLLLRPSVLLLPSSTLSPSRREAEKHMSLIFFEIYRLLAFLFICRKFKETLFKTKSISYLVRTTSNTQ